MATGTRTLREFSRVVHEKRPKFIASRFFFGTGRWATEGCKRCGQKLYYSYARRTPTERKQRVTCNSQGAIEQKLRRAPYECGGSMLARDI